MSQKGALGVPIPVPVLRVNVVESLDGEICFSLFWRGGGVG